jgi:hypothetical protein
MLRLFRFIDDIYIYIFLIALVQQCYCFIGNANIFQNLKQFLKNLGEINLIIPEKNLKI